MNVSRSFVSLAVIAALTSCATAPQGPAPQGRALRASLPDLTSYALMRTDAGALPAQHVSVAQAAEVLAGYDVIFIGEVHQHPANHLAQMELLRALYERSPALSLSMEQFERDTQPAVDEYLAGKVGETPFMQKSRAWNNYTTSYRPLVEYAKQHKLPVIAANAPGGVVRCIGREGPAMLARLKPEQRAWVAADLNLQDGPYKDKFLGFAGGDAGHGGETSKDKTAERKPPSETALRSFSAQVARDDTMAESIAFHLQKNPGRKVVHTNGAFHSESFLGTAERLKLRMPNLKIAVINPEFADDPTRLEVSPQDAKTGTFVLLLRKLPEFYANDEEMSAAIKKQMQTRATLKCEF
jgi:uncharacterized iron-regulated protein